MSATRFSRNGSSASTPKQGEPAPITTAATSGEVGDLTLRHQALQSRGQELGQLRMRYEFQLESLTATDKALSQQAHALGIDTPESLLALIEKQEQADKAALDEYEKALNEEEALLDEVDHALSQLGAAE
jgi:hypothetical protein